MLKRATSMIDPETEALVSDIIGCALAVHSALGPSYHEAVYQDALAIDRVHLAQVAGYLKASGLRVGLLINFNAPLLKAGLRRVVR